METKEQEGTKESCTCSSCQRACTFKPGWFLPGEAEQTATYLGIPLQQLFAEKLAVDWWEEDSPVFVLSPAILEHEAGTEFPSDPRGTCVFFRDGRCAIHPVKPFECHESLHGVEPGNRHERVRTAWESHQWQIQALLQRPPQAQSFSLIDSLLLGGAWGRFA